MPDINTIEDLQRMMDIAEKFRDIQAICRGAESKKLLELGEKIERDLKSMDSAIQLMTMLIKVQKVVDRRTRRTDPGLN